MTTKPENVGILAIEVYFPKTYISQDELEDRDIELLGEDYRAKLKGKYTKGLGQTALAYCSDREDVVSIAMNAVSSLMAKYGLTEDRFGRLEVGTESAIDRSKSIKSFLMALFPHNHSLIGVDNTNACYGGTAALLNSLAWVESSQWDGRLALVVCADIAVYDEMSARPTGGCGAVAMVVGPNAPIAVETQLLASHFIHGYDFYKPDPQNPHPRVDGPLSLALYYECLDNCFLGYRAKQKSGRASIDDFDYVCFHTPFMNHIKKCCGRLVYLGDKSAEDAEELRATRSDPRFMSELSAKHRGVFNEKVLPSCLLSMFCGNGYTSSLYLAIASLVNAVELNGKRVLCFSYGSGCASTMFSLRITGDLSKMKENLNLQERLDKRIKKKVVEYEQSIKREHERYMEAPYTPKDPIEDLWDNIYYLDCVDDKWMRHYKKMSEKKECI